MSNNSMSFAYDSIIFDKHRVASTEDIEFIFNEEVIIEQNPLKIDNKLKLSLNALKDSDFSK